MRVVVAVVAVEVVDAEVRSLRYMSLIEQAFVVRAVVAVVAAVAVGVADAEARWLREMPLLAEGNPQ